MDDLEITNRCAEKMGYSFAKRSYGLAVVLEDETICSHAENYSPLTNYAQALTLVEKLRLDIEPQKRDGKDGWAVYRQESMLAPTLANTWNQDILRAICECAAKITVSQES